MPVRLDQVFAPAPRPARPRIWLWLGLLPLFVLLGFAMALLFSTQPLPQQSMGFWGIALGAPLGGWCVLSLGRVLLYSGQHLAADGWDEAREEDIARRIRQGRRSQQVLGACFYSALRASGEQPTTQLDALLDGTIALKAQPSSLDDAPLRHSRLPGYAKEDPEIALLQVVVHVLADLAQTLAQLPDEQPLALLLEVDSDLPETQLRRVWRQAWSESGIRQSVVAIEECGLAAVDQWLDQRIDDQALLLIVAVRFSPAQPEGTAEAAVGLLLGNRLTQAVLPPIAYLHRPEQEREPGTERLRSAVRQALDWVPLDTESIAHVWRAGIDSHRDAAITTVLAELSMPVTHDQGLLNLDVALGDPGKASPWLAIACAVQTIQRGAGPQFIISGAGSIETGIWSTVLTPVPPLSK